MYGGKSCSLYEVGGETFLANQTGWDAEMVSPCRVPVLKEERIADIYGEIMSAVSRGACTLHLYSDSEEYRRFLKEELSERVLQFRLTREQMDSDPRFQRYINRLLDR